MTTARARRNSGSGTDCQVRSDQVRSDEPRVAKAARIAALENDLQKLSDEQLRARTEQFKKEIAGGKDLDGLRRQRPASGRQET